MRPSFTWFPAIALVQALVTIAVAGAARAGEADRAVLRELKAPTEPAALIEHLRAWGGGRDDAPRAAVLIAKLGAETFAERDAAEAELAGWGWPALRFIEPATGHDDLEVRARAQAVIQRIKAFNSVHQRLLSAALRELAERPAPGGASVLADLAPHCLRYEDREAMDRALEAGVRPADRGGLEERLRSDRGSTRAAAVLALGALGRAQGDGQAVDALRVYLTDRDEAVRFAAARALLARDPRACLMPLAELLDAEDGRVRRHAVAQLREMTGQHFGYSAVADPQARREPAMRWRAWVREQGGTAPLRTAPTAPPAPLGRVLISLPNKGVVERDAEGKGVWEWNTLRSVMGVQGLPGGGRVLCDFHARVVVEFDASGKEVWRKPTPGGAFAVERLTDGNTLLALVTERQVVELDRSGAVAWRLAVPGSPSDAHRLANGRTLVALQDVNAVVEFDAEGKEVWRAAAARPQSVRRLADGSTLIASATNKVVRLDASGKTVWEAEVGRPYDAVALPSGNTLVATQTGLLELDAQGKPARPEETIGYVRRLSAY